MPDGLDHNGCDAAIRDEDCSSARGSSPSDQRPLESALASALRGDLLQAKSQFDRLLRDTDPSRLQSLNLNNLAAVEAALGQNGRAIELLELALKNDSASATAALNLGFLRSHQAQTDGSRDITPASRDEFSQQRVAILSLLFNWPSTGGGTVHTKELAESLQRQGYLVQHLYAAYAPWGVGVIQEQLPYPAHELQFSANDWKPKEIMRRFHGELGRFSPDWVIVTDSWNSKPLLVEAAASYRTLIRVAAQECLCPLNNVRLLVGTDGRVQQCSQTQFANPEYCQKCVATHGRKLSGGLHQAERELSQFGTPEYAANLRRAFANADGVLAVNPQIAESLRPFVRAAYVVPSGFDVRRFSKVDSRPSVSDRRIRMLFAGITQEFMKGFHVLRRAGEILWRRRQDFEIWATGDGDLTSNSVDTAPWLKFVGWQSQAMLPKMIQACDLLVFPTIAQEALGRTAVEAMACGRPVVASRLGGLSWVVKHEVTGLLCRPGDSNDLAMNCERLLDDPALRERLGQSGREQFEREWTWEAIMARHYLPLLGAPVKPAVS